MLGEVLGDSIGQVTGTRVLPSSGEGLRLEVSFQADGTILGRHDHEVASYEVTVRADGTMYGEGQGVIQTEDGDVATWRGAGAGTQPAPGRQSFRGAIYFSTQSERLARLNNVAVVYEYQVDESGKTEAKLWEWK